MQTPTNNNNNTPNAVTILPISGNFTLSIIGIMITLVGYLIVNQVSLEKRLTTLEVNDTNRSNDVKDIKSSVDRLSMKIDSLLIAKGK